MAYRDHKPGDSDDDRIASLAFNEAASASVHYMQKFSIFQTVQESESEMLVPHQKSMDVAFQILDELRIAGFLESWHPQRVKVGSEGFAVAANNEDSESDSVAVAIIGARFGSDLVKLPIPFEDDTPHLVKELEKNSKLRMAELPWEPAADYVIDVLGRFLDRLERRE
ncbi:MAG: hypothetical protein ABJZ55_05060 [Fuerstiella sp.]